MCIESQEDLDGLREAGQVVRAVLNAMEREVRPGVTTAYLNRVGTAELRQHEARSAPMLVYGFPAEICISVNDEVVHGIPSDRSIQRGDLVTLDVTAEKNGYMADAAVTVAVKPITDRPVALVRSAEQAFWKSLRVARAGKRINQIGQVVESTVRQSGFAVVRQLAGHGIGRTIHEAPQVPNYYEPWLRRRLTQGLVITIEPIVAAGSGRVFEADDGWTVKTTDGSLSAHYEHTVVITKERPIVVTAA